MAQTATMPVTTPTPVGRSADPCVMVIFGASGDLTQRKLIPALYNLARVQLLSPNFAVVGVARRPMSSEEYRRKLSEEVREFVTGDFDAELWDAFVRRMHYLAGNFDNKDTYENLKQLLGKIDQESSTRGNYFYYLATAPDAFGEIVESLAAAGLMQQDNGHWRRVIIEKPFGHDLESARELNRQLLKVAEEQQIYRIDHYLGKETVQNILAFRFANGIFEPVWNRRFVNHVQITAAETIGVEGRGGYYQEAGALRDMIQSHLLQVTATIAMEPPAAFDPETVRDERARLLRAIKIMTPQEVRENAVAGQYRGFRQEKDVKPDSMTETYAAVALQIENWRWAGVPFYLRTGKKLMRHVTDIAIQFNDAPLAMFGPGTAETAHPNLLIVRIQPEEAISLRFLSKQPGSGMRLRPVSMDFNYGASFGERGPTAYETLLVDAMIGDPTLYTREDMVEASWRAVQPILDDWSHRKFDFPNYEPGSWGPKEADEMLARRGHQWRNS